MGTQTTPYLTRQDLLEHLQRLRLFSHEIEWALSLAEETHGRQCRDDGTPYLEEHVFPIAAAVADYVSAQGWESAEASSIVTVALLHDVLEDSPKLEAADLAAVFGEQIAQAVVALSKSKDRVTRTPEERELEYFRRILKAPTAVKVVKVFDRLNNLACIHKSSPEKREKYIQETFHFHLPLAESIDHRLAQEMLRVLERLTR